ncbi:heme ABC transporter ATP-binding protein [Crassaminicella indica]|uniref:Heme ABC transporter ATP-binding protein n=1 Tax=Crassaminicella indica TaxID=2855394 RepID=A0ABX8RCR7_9CLOT|nr:heme ABC transporter ATP-binding protein [Crassaminicella indica]QXM06852.1 heme ABC transporter ATP-binding protein [Crassaminicella indica]
MKKLTYPIEIDHLNWSFGENNILKNISVKIAEKKFTCIIGPNGSGKSTLLKNILKLLSPHKKSIYIYSEDVVNLKYKDLARKIAAVPQNTMVDFDFTVMDIVLMGRSPHLKRFEVESEEDFQIVKKAMQLTNTWHLKDRGIHKISGGERQRVIIARALAQQSQILILDEPISNLDIHHQIEVLNIAKELCTNKNITVLAVLHDLNFAIQYSDYLILLNKGEIIAEGLPEQVITKKNIKKVYNIDVYMMKNPITGKPHIIPIIS